MRSTGSTPVELVLTRVRGALVAPFWFSLTMFLCFTSSATVIHVPGDYSTIQAAIDAAIDGDEIIVSPGTYGPISVTGRDIILRSTEPTNRDVVVSTIIQRGPGGSVVVFSGTETEACTLSGFTITHSVGSGRGIEGRGTLAGIRNNVIRDNRSTENGGGIHDCDGVIEDNTIEWNSASGNGGGLYGCDGIIQNNVISNNSSADTAHYYAGGGGLALCQGTIVKNIICDNSAARMGGALFWCVGTIQDNLVYRNSAQLGGGLGYCDASIANNTVYGNLAADSGGGMWFSNPTHGVVNCIVWANTAPGYPQIYVYDDPRDPAWSANYCCIQNWTGGGSGNITDDPNLVDPDTGNLHLRPSSPCVDAGCYVSDVTEDFDGDARPYDATSEPRGDGSDFDIGADEFITVIVPDDYPTIQQALDAASDGWEIIVSPGIYVENINLGGKDIVLRSTDPVDPHVVANTIIDGARVGSVVTFSGWESPACILSGFTIRNGGSQVMHLYGCGIDGNGTMATIQNNTIRNNGRASYGGGIDGCYGTIQNNIICHNSAFMGGGLSHCRGVIQNNTIYSNYATDSGGGLYFCCWAGRILNCIVWGNTASSDAQLYDCGDPSYCCIQDWGGGGQGNISEDPLLVDAMTFNFRLRGDSPCVDAGCYVPDLIEDFEGDLRGYDGTPEPRGDGLNFDIGADEYAGEPWLAADFSASPTSGEKPLEVKFTDMSLGEITSWSWDFGDGSASAEQNPTHTYSTTGSFTVSLTVTGPGGWDTETKTTYVHVIEPVPVAAFSAAPTSGASPLQTQFTDLSTGEIASWSWSFGDGGTGTEQDPAHTYQTVGNFTVSLTVEGPGGSDTETKTEYIHATEPVPVAAFSAATTSGLRPFTVQFTDESSGTITSWSWVFGDGETGTQQNPSHTYNTSGYFTVSLTVSGPGGPDTETKTNYIHVVEPAPVAEFTATPTSGPVPFQVQFIDQSTGEITSWLWDFGDGGTSTTRNPSHTYTSAGYFTVSLTVTSPAGSDTETKTNYIHVTETAPVAAFSASPTSGQRPLTVQFSDQSTGTITSWAWSFGDGGTSTLQSPSHTYNSTGYFTVSLTVTGPGGSVTVTKTNYIHVTESVPTAVFVGSPTSGNRPLVVQFTDQSTGSITSWSWSFGDGGTSTLQSPSHTYNSAGYFTVSLTVTGTGGSDTMTRTNYIHVTETAPPVAAFSASPTSGYGPSLTVQFTDQSTGVITSWSWSFGDGFFSSEQNPSHTYTSSGRFTVSLTVTGTGGSDTETKTNFISVWHISDIDQDGDVDEDDAQIILEVAVGLLPHDPDCDLNRDGAVNAMDAIMCLKVVN